MQQQRQQLPTLILFDEADVLLEEDRGFVGALAALITDTKVRVSPCKIVQSARSQVTVSTSN